MDFDDYETLPCGSTTTHMVAGAFAGIMEHCVMYPLDSVKTRMQSLKPSPKAYYRSIPEAFSKIIRHEGVLRPVRGMSAVVVGAGPAHALYFSCYEKMKRMISGTEHGSGKPLAQGLAGAVSTLLHDAIMNPADVVKQRLQMYNSPYKSCLECFKNIWKTEGARAFYRSYTTQLTMNVPFQSIHFMTYEFCQELTNHKRTYNPLAHMFSGAISGAFAAAVTTPLDVCKTLLNTQEQQALNLTKQTQISGLINAATVIYRFSGPRGYFRGMQARVIYQVPSTAIAWSVYEFFKYTIGKYDNYKPEHSSLIAHASSMENKHPTSEELPRFPVVYSK
ncbi:mitoferrin-2-like [Uloborus diversus]|uniref:mitoferrin-2-like n=1 Tax=Uloborus diversus TaxID=327109 RepID=UPI002409DA20|nr:mitoferrin-2-like [Uloborus diversus]XP_054718517.1 mitoferrin-2-like [Uloborus diversus]